MALTDPSPDAIPRPLVERAQHRRAWNDRGWNDRGWNNRGWNNRVSARILAETRAHLAAPLTLAGLGAAVLVCGIAGPFGTDAYLADGPRFLFWAAMVAITYAAGTLASETAWQVVGWRLSALKGRLVCALGPALVTPPLVLSLNTLMLGTPYPFEGLAAFAASLFVVGGLVGLLADLATGRPFGRAGGPGAPGARAGIGGVGHGGVGHGGEPVAPPRLVARLPDHLRGPLVSLSAQDHRVLVRTTRGEALVLMRLADAIAAADGTPGLRVHRSHWVAWSQVREVRRSGTGWTITLAAGPDVPVSRAHVPTLRAAGLLPEDPEAEGRADG